MVEERVERLPLLRRAFAHRAAEVFGLDVAERRLRRQAGNVLDDARQNAVAHPAHVLGRVLEVGGIAIGIL